MFSKSGTRNIPFLSILKAPASIAVCLFFFAGFADGAMLPFFALWAQKDAGISVAYIGALFGCYAGGEILATPLLGGMADRVGRRPVLLLSTLGVGGGFACLYFTHGVAQAAVVLILIGVCESVLHPTLSTVIADTIPVGKTRDYFALARVMSGIGHALGPAVGALLVLRSLGTVFLASAASLLIAAGIVACCLPETWQGREEGAEEEDDEGLSALLPAFRDRRLAGLLGWVTLLEVSGSWVETVLPLYAHGAGSLSPSGVGLLFTFGAVLVVVFQYPVTRLLANVPGSTLIVWSGVVSVAAFLTLLLSPGLWAMVVAMTFFSLAQMLSGPLIPATVNELAPAHLRATYMAAVSVTNDLKDTLGPATGTVLFAVTARLPWLLGIPLAGAAAIALGITLRRRETHAA